MLGSLCQINRVPFDPALVAQQYPPPHSEATFIEAAKALGFRVVHCDTSGRKLPERTFPLLARLRSPDADQSPPTSASPDIFSEPDAVHTTEVTATGAVEMPTAFSIKLLDSLLVLARHQRPEGEGLKSTSK